MHDRSGDPRAGLSIDPFDPSPMLRRPGPRVRFQVRTTSSTSVLNSSMSSKLRYTLAKRT